MAIKITKKGFSINIAASVAQALDGVKAVRVTEQAKKGAEFQKAVASGMSYESQSALLRKMIDDEKLSPLQDENYINDLEVNLANAQKMARFEKIRNKYNDALDSYIQDKSSLDSYISVLEDSLSTETSDQMRTELRNLLSNAKKEQAQNNLNAINNRALLAQKDNSVALIDNSIKEVTDKKAIASLNGNEDEVVKWDQTLLALRSSKSKLQIEDGLNDLTLKINRNNPKANDKISYLNEEINKADSVHPVTYNGITYSSLKDFWMGKRDEYISNSYFKEAKAEIDAETSKLAATNAFGQIPVARIQAVSQFYDNLKNTDGFQNFVDIIDQQKVGTVNVMTIDLATSIYDQVNAEKANVATNAERDAITVKADSIITNLETQFGVKLPRGPTLSEASAGKSTTTSIDTQLKNIPSKQLEPVLSASSSTNLAEIKRAQDVYMNADRLAGTGKYIGQTADQIRENAHNYANDIRAGRVNLDNKSQSIITDQPTPPPAQNNNTQPQLNNTQNTTSSQSQSVVVPKNTGLNADPNVVAARKALNTNPNDKTALDNYNKALQDYKTANPTT